MGSWRGLLTVAVVAIAAVLRPVTVVRAAVRAARRVRDEGADDA